MMILRLPPSDARRVGSIAFSPDGQFIAAASSDCHLRLYRLHDGTLWRDHLFTDRAYEHQIAYLTIDRMVVAGSFLSIWEIADDRWTRIDDERLISVHYAIHPDGELLV